MLLGDSLMNNYFLACDKAQNKIGFSAPLALQVYNIKQNFFLNEKTTIKLI